MLFKKINTLIYTKIVQNFQGVKRYMCILSTQATSNVFCYTLRAKERVLEVLPRTYHETMWYLHGRRQFRYALGLDEDEKAEGAASDLENVSKKQFKKDD